MNLTELEQTILMGAVADLLQFRKAKWAIGEFRTAEFRASLRAMEAAKEGVIRFDPARWLGHALQGPAERMAVSRAYAKLEKAGLAERLSFYDEARCTYLKPTRAGIKFVKELRKQ